MLRTMSVFTVTMVVLSIDRRSRIIFRFSRDFLVSHIFSVKTRWKLPEHGVANFAKMGQVSGSRRVVMKNSISNAVVLSLEFGGVSWA